MVIDMPSEEDLLETLRSSVPDGVKPACEMPSAGEDYVDSVVDTAQGSGEGGYFWYQLPGCPMTELTDVVRIELAPTHQAVIKSNGDRFMIDTSVPVIGYSREVEVVKPDSNGRVRR